MVLTIVTVMSFLAASMTAMFMMNVNLTQSSFNGDIALTEAEAALSELMYKLGQDDTHSFGKANQEIRGQVTPGFRLDEAYHVLTFRTGTGFRYSTNNVGGSATVSGDGRTVPVDCVHVYSTGVCRGQRRVIEAVIRKPPAPYGLCASGPIHSISPLTITGLAADTTDYNPATGGDRPGHLVCNSPAGVTVDAPGSNITGFVRSVGPIDVAGPSQVSGGLQPNASNTVLLDIDIAALNPKAPMPAASPNEGGMTGVVEIIETNHDNPQELDVMYYCGHDLVFNAPVQLKDAFLYVKGKLTINGGLWGTGAIVVDGDVSITGGTSLTSANNSEVALLASGMIDLNSTGNANNCFRGIVYSEKGLNAKNMVVIGSAIVNDPTGVGGACELDQMTFVGDEDSGKVVFTSKSYDDATVQVSDSLESPYKALAFIGAEGDPDGMWWPDIATDGTELTVNKIVFQMMGGNVGGITIGPGQMPPGLDSDPVAYAAQFAAMGTDPPLAADDGSSPWQTQAMNLYTTMQAAAVALNSAAIALEAEEDKLADMEDDTPPPPGLQAQRDLVNSLRNGMVGKKNTFLAAVDTYNTGVRQMAQNFVDWAMQRSNANGSYRERGERPTNVERKFTFDLNRYLPYSDRLHVTYWQVAPERK